MNDDSPLHSIFAGGEVITFRKTGVPSIEIDIRTKRAWYLGRPTKYTFEINHGLNPIAFATRKTADRVRKFVRKQLPQHFSVRVFEPPNIFMGPIPERQIIIGYRGKEYQFSAGHIASGLIRMGEQIAAQQLKAEIIYHTGEKY